MPNHLQLLHHGLIVCSQGSWWYSLSVVLGRRQSPAQPARGDSSDSHAAVRWYGMQYSPPAADRKTFPGPPQPSALPEMGINSGKGIVLSFMTSMGMALSLKVLPQGAFVGSRGLGGAVAREGMVIDRWRCEGGKWG